MNAKEWSHILRQDLDALIIPLVVVTMLLDDEMLVCSTALRYVSPHER